MIQEYKQALESVQLTSTQSDFIQTSVKALTKDDRVLGVAAGGSFILGEMDEYSDLDLVLYIEASGYEAILKTNQILASEIGPLLQSFSGDHVGEPRLLICLYGPPLLHVDLKFVSLEDVHDKVETPRLLWERDRRVSSLLAEKDAHFPQPDRTWIQARFWTWVHYILTKIGRGELFEAVDALGFIRGRVLGPLYLSQTKFRPQGVRKLETALSMDLLKQFERTIPRYEAKSCLAALEASIKLYEAQEIEPPSATMRTLILEYMDEIKTKTQKDTHE